MTAEQTREYYEHIDHAMQELWRLHYKIEDEKNPTRKQKQIDARTGTVIKKLWEIRDIIREET